MPRSLAGAAISLGLVTIPVKLYSATRSLMPAFHLIHQQCGSRIKEQLYCPKDERVVSREELVRGYEIAKDRYVTFTPEELDALRPFAKLHLSDQLRLPPVRSGRGLGGPVARGTAQEPHVAGVDAAEDPVPIELHLVEPRVPGGGEATSVAS